MKEENKVINGISAELLSASITYPLNTIKTNFQVGKNIKLNFKNLSKGFGWCIITELTSALIFYSIFEHLKYNHGSVKASIIGSTISTFTSYPLNVRRKTSQIGKKIIYNSLTENYKGLKIGLINSIPGTVINFSLRDYFKEVLPEHLKPFGCLLSTAISLIATHPLDTLSTCVSTRTPIKLIDCINYRGFRERFFEKNINIGGKMLLLESFNNNTFHTPHTPHTPFRSTNTSGTPFRSTLSKELNIPGTIKSI